MNVAFNPQYYAFQRCERSALIKNKYTGQLLYTSCGVCKSCLVRRATQMTMLCGFEQEDYQFTYFVTLTYSEEFVPRARYYYDEDGHFKLVNECPRLPLDDMYIDNEYILCSLLMQQAKIASLRQDSDRSKDTLMFVSVRDIQLFLKRLRKHLSKYTDEKIRYYVVSEYGPKHLRPHYHLLLFFNSPQTAYYLHSCVSKAWTFGRIDCQRARQGVGGYVAQYVNSDATLPDLYKIPALKPFTLHSIYFAQSYYRRKRKEIYQTEPARLVEQTRVVGTRVAVVHPWRSYVSTFFPRSARYDETTHYQRLYAYRLLLHARLQYETSCSIYQLAKKIICDLADSVLNPVTDFVASLFQGRDYNISTVYNLLNTSRHFLEFVCDGDDRYNTSEQYLKKIEDFYDCRAQYNLKRFYENQLYYLHFGGSQRGLINFYDNVFVRATGTLMYKNPAVLSFISSIDEYKRDGKIVWPRNRDRFYNDGFYKSFVSWSHSKYAKNIKHKEINDELKVLFDI